MFVIFVFLYLVNIEGNLVSSILPLSIIIHFDGSNMIPPSVAFPQLLLLSVNSPNAATVSGLFWRIDSHNWVKLSFPDILFIFIIIIKL